MGDAGQVRLGLIEHERGALLHQCLVEADARGELEARQLEVDGRRCERVEHRLEPGAVEAPLDHVEPAGIGLQHDHGELAAEVGERSPLATLALWRRGRPGARAGTSPSRR